MIPSTPNHSPWRFCTAPMMDWSDRHCRYFWRLLSQRARLYTEMINTGALLRGDSKRFLRFHAAESPLALQLGGSHPAHLAACARMAEDAGFAEVNLNCGCPSDRVQEGRIGACLMAEPQQVADCISAMRNACGIEITLKHRLGIDHLDSREHLHDFVALNAQAGCRVFIVHARKAWLQGLSPKQNREIPPLQYERVLALKEAFPQLTIVLNGGLNQLQACAPLLQHLDGVMMGRAAYHTPYVLAQVDRLFFDAKADVPSRQAVFEAFAAYAQQALAEGERLHSVTKGILGLFHGEAGGRVFRRVLSEQAPQKNAGIQVLWHAYNAMQAAADCVNLPQTP